MTRAPTAAALVWVALGAMVLAACPELPPPVEPSEGPALDSAAMYGVPPDRGLVARRLIRDVGLMKPADADLVVSAVRIVGVEVHYAVHRRADLSDGACVGTLVLEPAGMGPPDARRTASFAVRADNPGADADVAALLDRLLASVSAHDDGSFYVIDPSLRIDAAPTRAPPASDQVADLASTHRQSLWAFGLLLVWLVSLVLILATRRQRLEIAGDFKPTHLLPAVLQACFLAYWALYFEGVGEQLPYLLAQVAFGYGLDILLQASRSGGRVTLGVGVLPIVGSANLFVWYGGADAWLGYLTIALAIGSKAFIRRDERHRLNPSGFGVAVTGLCCLLWPETFGFFDISHQFNAGPNMLEVIFLLALIAAFRVPIILASIGGLLGLVLTVETGLLVQPTPMWGPVFLAIALLVTDPATMPRTPLGKLVFGLGYGVSVAALSTALGANGESDFFAKVLTIPLLNLLVPWFDRLGEGVQLKGLDRRFNTAHVLAWIVLVMTLLLTTDAKRGGLEHNRFDPIASPQVVSGDGGRATCADNPAWCRPFSFDHDVAVISAAPDPGEGPSLVRSTDGLALILVLALFGLLVDLPRALRDLHLRGPDSRQVWAWLLGITAAAALARGLLPATFIREAHPLLSVPLQLDAPLLGLPIDLYPQGPQLMAAVFRPLLPDDPYAAWFIANKILGVLGIPAMFALGAAALGTARGGLVAAALLALWPQHLRVTASESVHVAMMLWATVGFAWTFIAARSGRFTALAAAVLAFAACSTTRPEAGFWGLAAVPAALAAGPGVRKLLSRPRTWPPLLAVVALLTPMLLEMVGSSAAGRLSPTSGAGESVGLGSVWTALVSLVIPDGRNAFFDVATTPAWLWPLALLGAVAGWRQGRRGLVVSAGLATFGYLVLYAHLGPAGSVWPMARYQAAALPAVCLLTSVGAIAVAARFQLPPRRVLPVVVAVSVAGTALWSPALRIEMDWQRELRWWIDLSRRPVAVVPPNAIVVTPDNRRRFLDLTPRDAIEPLTRGAQHGGQAWTVAHAVEHLHPERESRPAWFYAGLYCYLGTSAEEPYNPQCQAMKDTFELEPIETLQLDAATYLAAYQHVRAEAPLELALYRVRRRVLDPAAALRRLPAPIAPGDPDHVLPMGAGAAPQVGPPEPLAR